MWRLFCPREYRAHNKRHGFLEEGSEGEEKFCVLFYLLFLNEFLQEGLRELWLPASPAKHGIPGRRRVLRQAEFPQH
jgi:hypothetical protein